MNKNPSTTNKEVVTVSVISYNSESTVLETLNSIYEQSYGPENIELIISDDGSKDETVKVVNAWLKDKSIYFKDVNFIANQINEGVSKNVNHAWKAANSKWIKTIAADDILLPHCIQSYSEYVVQNPEVRIVFSSMEKFDSKTGSILGLLPDKARMDFFIKSANEQYCILLKDSFNFAPTSFILAELLTDVGYADERFQFLEDLPLWLKITKSGNQLYFLNQVTVKYRIGDSLSNSTTRLINRKFYEQMLQLYKLYIFPNLKNDNFFIFNKKIEIKSTLWLGKITRNKRTFFTLFLLRCLLLTRPIWYKQQYRKLISYLIK
jgi:glycosyltransferase involved in cell wall biosynthesis